MHEGAPADVSHPRNIRSFVRRTGRTTVGQAKAFADVGPRFLLAYTGLPMDFSAVYERDAPTILEIGFGMGEATAHIAGLMPEKNFLCCEVHTPGVGALLKRIDEQALTNIRILQHDAVEVIDHMLPLGSLDGVHIFFPDPWHKTKHNKRRLIQAAADRQAGGAPQARRLPALRDRLAAVCRADPGSAERRALAEKHGRRRQRWLRAQARLPAADQV